jgi:hypothetical protein
MGHYQISAEKKVKAEGSGKSTAGFKASSKNRIFTVFCWQPR